MLSLSLPIGALVEVTTPSGESLWLKVLPIESRSSKAPQIRLGFHEPEKARNFVVTRRSEGPADMPAEKQPRA